jgi:hypothetical protein
MNRELLGRLVELRALTRAQLESARKLDGIRLQELGLRREELLFDIQLLMDEDLPVPDEQRETIRQVCREISQFEERLAQVSRTVLGVLGVPSDVDTYDRQGRLGLAG